MSDVVVGSPGVTAETYWLARHPSISAWVEHTPFAYWVMAAARPDRLVELGTHTGFSYFVFAEAARRLGLPTELVAIDSWEGDDQAGFYGDEVFEDVSRIAAADYAQRTILIRSYFNEAVDRVADGSVDLLHIDGRHGYEDVQEDFELYEPKLSERAVVLFHDTNEFAPGFGVHRFWDELAEGRKTFNFHHGHGLGVLAHGSRVAPAVLDFIAAANEKPERIRGAFAALGAEAARANNESLRRQGAERRVAELQQELQRTEADLIGLQQQHDATLASSSWRLTAPLRSLGNLRWSGVRRRE